ncbi:4-alpha-D-((1-_4)-alpha-D-glucano)trehalose trehalohydrolase [Acetobacter pasteurianus]|uniref:4-alpha-D-((1->4)-alpha-D-glucano)trehalose trehalohydrolase n=1 Tax=Acetobacter pasteurianus TaxID=438 RepID=A0A1A0DAX4_ACEPA|nr:hypothetical protein [Acetobacter pasteurianus]OAZ72438.1 4-alpha-D-((1->4)-alpha-D-glucano)trehalose trehalohydrolase [Acetobacter pasteurianus]
MPTLTINGHDVDVGDEFLKLSPEQQNATVDEIAHSMGTLPKPAQNTSPSIVEGTGRGIATGVPILGGLANKLDAATDATLAPALNGLFSPNQQLNGNWSQRYQQALAVQNGADQLFAERHPITNTAAQLAGGISSGLGATAKGLTLAGKFGTAGLTGARGLLARAGLAAAENSAIGGADAATRGGNVLHGAGIGGAMGAGGAAAQSIGRSDWLGQISRALAGVGIGAAGGAAGAELDGGDPLAAAMTGAAAGAGGEAANAAAKPMAGATRVFDKEAGETKADRIFSARETAAEKIANALAREGTTDTDLSNRLGTMGKNATLMDVSPTLAQMAGAIGTEPGRGQSYLRKATDNREAESGQRVSNLVSDAMGPRGDGDALISALDDERRAAASPLYEKALATPVQDSDELQAVMGTDAFKRAIPTAERLAQNEGRSLYARDQKGNMQLDTGNMTLQDLHYIQRAMQDHITEARPGLGIKDNELSRSINNVRQNLLGQMDEMSPEYQQARSIYAGTSRVRDAYDEGLNAFDNSTGANHLTNEMMERKLDGYESQSERQAYLLGARQRISNIMGSARNNRQRAYTLFGIGNDNPDFENTAKLATLLSYVKPAETQEAALGAIQDEMRGRLGYSIAEPEQEEITPESVHGAENPLLNAEGELVHPDSEEGKQIIAKRMAEEQAARDEAAEELARQKAAAIEFTGPDKGRGQSVAEALVRGLQAERQFGETKDEVSGNSKTARRLDGKQLIASSSINLPNTVPSTVSKIASALANKAAGSVMRSRADAVNYEIARILASRNTSFAPTANTGGKRPSADPQARVAATLSRNPEIQKRRDISNKIAQALISAAITQSNINGAQ